MASRRNPQQVAINNSTSGNLTIIANPSTTAFMYIYELYLQVGGTTNLTFYNGLTPLTGPLALGTSVPPVWLEDEGGAFPRFVINPGQSFIVNDSAGVQKSGYCTFCN